MKIHFKVFAIVMGIVSAVILFTMAASVFIINRGQESTVYSQLTVISQLAEKYISSEMELLELQTDDVVEHLEARPRDEWPAALQDGLDRYPFLLGLTVFSRENERTKVGVATAPENLKNGRCVKNARAGRSAFSTTQQSPNELIVFYFCVPMDKENVLVATLQGLYFSHLLKDYKIWDTGSIFIVDGEGTFVAAERMKMVVTRYNPLEETRRTDPTATEFVRRMVDDRKGEGYGRYRFEGRERQAVFRAISAKNVDWVLGVAAPIAESPGGHFYRGLIAMSLIFLGFGGLSALFLSGFISKQFRTINEQNKHLADLNRIAKSASDTKSDFLANMSHEMRTPLNAIVGFSELMLNGISRPEEAEDNMGKIYAAGVTLLGIVNDILDISKIESGKFELVPVEYEFASMINDTVTVNMVRIGEKKIKFILTVDPDIPYRLYGDELRIKQICNNFLSNAFKYTKEGEVELSVSSAVNGDDVWLILSVRDTGIGIRKEDVAKLFSAYNQVDTKSNRLIEGTGLGLSIAKRMAQMMDGTIDVESDYGSGSTFTATVKQKFVTDKPIGKEVAQELMNFQFQRKKSSLHNKLAINKMPYARVLIVDDVQTNLDVARGMLKPYGMKIDCATSGMMAVNLIRTGEPRYDAVFMDHMMPEMDGIEAVSVIRNQIGTDYARNVPIIALTANAIIGNEKMFLSNGFQAYLSKPMDMTKVDKVLNDFVRNREKEEEGASAPAGESGDDGSREEPAPRPATAKGSGPVPGNGAGGEAAPESPEESLPRIPGVDLEAGVERFGGDPEIFLSALKSYAANTGPLLEGLREPREDTLKDYMITVHGIKSSSYGVSALECGKAAERLEKAAKEGDLPFILERNSGFIETAEKLIEDIRSALREAEEDAGSGKAVLEKPDRDLINSLIACCENYDMDGIDQIIGELDKHAYQDDPHLVEWLKERAETMDFERISEKFQSG
ncbi:MAG: response regulator [Deltaproteobacteria bacterium]|jgi:signal transduction histidine kinase/DNA-binding NarL/FixJ family response regulator/HPt (histidine-containing phosphotransfer) domain-containing protein|nr:response regulator [Deltaproteobacteria bacterium]